MKITQRNLDKNFHLVFFYRFVKGHKEYVYNNKIPHYTCLCELCENAILISKGIEKAIKVKQVPTTPRYIVEVYSCDDRNKECAMGECNEGKVHDLVKSDFIGDVSSEELCFLSKIQMILDVGDALSLWHKHVTRMKRHMFTKRHEVYVNLKENLSTNEMIVHLDYSENYKSTQQNEIQIWEYIIQFIYRMRLLS